jgi:hypothetical protein
MFGEPVVTSFEGRCSVADAFHFLANISHMINSINELFTIIVDLRLAEICRTIPADLFVD